MPKVVTLPVSANLTAVCTAWVNAFKSLIKWSAVKNSMTASGPCCLWIVNAAAAIAGAVLRPCGSRMKPSGMGMGPVSRYSSAVLKNKSRLVTVKTSTASGKLLARKKDFCNKLWPSAKRIKGLGCCSRETGHKRVPAPPDRITGISFMLNRQNRSSGIIAFQGRECAPSSQAR